MKKEGATQGKDLYIHDNYDVTPYWSPSPADRLNNNPLSRLVSAVAAGLNANDKIPKIILIVIDDILVLYTSLCDPDKLILWIMTQVRCMIRTKIDYLSKRAKPDYSTRVIFTKPFPEPDWADVTRQHLTDKRNINHAMDR